MRGEEGRVREGRGGERSGGGRGGPPYHMTIHYVLRSYILLRICPTSLYMRYEGKKPNCQRQTDRQTDGQMDRQMDGRTDRWTDGQTDKQSEV